MSNHLKAMIIEDESLARDLLKNFLGTCPDIELIGEAADGFEAVRLINKKKPDLIFLDIRIPKLSGFEVLELLDYKPRIIFTTAHDEYAVKAFEMNAIDYLLKPFSKERFQAAVDKVVHQKNTILKVQQPSLPSGLEEDSYLKRIVVKSGHRIVIIRREEIVCFEARDDYVLIHTKDTRYLKKNTMKYYETYLGPDDFVRVHRSYLINVNFLSRLEQYDKESYRINLTNKMVIPVSRNGYKRLKLILNI